MDTEIGVYLDLFDGQIADIEVIANVAISLAAAVREAAYILDPSASIEIKLDSAPKASLNLRSVLRVSGVDADKAEGLLKTVIVLLIIWFGDNVSGFMFDRWLNILFPKDQSESLTDAELKAIEDAVGKALRNGEAANHVRKIYRELEKDPAIRAIGVTPDPDSKPTTLVPRGDFSQRATPSSTIDPGALTRDIPVRETVTLISPVLMPGDRRWKFSSRGGVFGAPMRDGEFLERILSGTHHIKMVSGIEMDVDINRKEVKKDGVWEIKEIEITKVHNVRMPPSQGELPIAPQH